ncbi:MAG TPA: hypothetical protein ENH82_13490 [bacterium]|nr:hypothetical protein [bacterium]
MRNSRSILLFTLLLGILAPQFVWAEVNFGDKFVVKFGQTVNEAVSIGDDVYVFGTVKEDAVSIGGDVFVEKNGCVNGNAVSIGGDIYVRNNGEVRKNTVNIAGKTYVDFGGLVRGDQISLFPANFFSNGFIENILKIIIFGPIIGIFGLIGFIIGLVISLLKLALLLAIAVFVTYFFPGNVSTMAEFTHKQFWKCFFLGFLAIIVIPFLTLALIITIIGIPIIPAFLVFLFLAYIYGSIGIALWVGRLIPGAVDRSDIVNVIIGVLILGVVKLIPAIGLLSKFVILAVSLGVIIFTRFGTQKNTIS